MWGLTEMWHVHFVLQLALPQPQLLYTACQGPMQGQNSRKITVLESRLAWIRGEGVCAAEAVPVGASWLVVERERPRCIVCESHA